MTSIPANLPHRHTDHETGHILHVDPITGNIIARKKMVRPKDRRAEYEAWVMERRADKVLSKDQETAADAIAKSKVQGETDGNPVDTKPKRGRGRPEFAYANPAAPYMHLLGIPNPLPWVDDIIRGAIITSVGVSNGKINVEARAVIGALFLSEITAKACKTSEITLRTAQRIAKATRHAAHGIASYVDRHTDLKARLDGEITAEALPRAPN